MRRGSSFVLFVLVAALVGLVAPAARADVPVLALDGRGFGHGVGLSQWGAKYMADAGTDVGTILQTFYPGTTIGSQGGNVRVAVLQAPGGSAQLTFPDGGEVRGSGAGFPVSVAPGGTVFVSYDGAYHVSGGVTAQSASAVEYRGEGSDGCIPLLGPCTTTPPDTSGGGNGGGQPAPGCGLLGCAPTTSPPTTAAPTTVLPPPTTAPPPSSDTTTPPPSDTTPAPAAGATSSDAVTAVPAGGGAITVPARGRSYRGVIHAVAGNGLRLVNELDVEQYLRGMGEVPSSWPLAAIEAQTIAARTYALRAMAVSGELCDSDRCQVYVGTSKETGGQVAAVDGTTGQVLLYGGALATAVYSADAGGYTANTLEGFGTPDGTYPYLTNRQYSTPDPLPWHVDVALADLGSRFGYHGSVTGVRITQQGPSGRALEVTLDGDAGPMAIGGRQFSSRLGLRSTLFTGTIGSASIAPPPPPAADAGFVEQALPDDSAALSAAVAAPVDPARDAATTSAVESIHAKSFLPPLPLARDLARSPAAYAGVATLGIATAVAMAWAGGLVPALPFAASTRPALAGLEDRLGRRRRRPPPSDPT